MTRTGAGTQRDNYYEEYKSLRKLYERLCILSEEIDDIQMCGCPSEDYEDPLDSIQGNLNDLIELAQKQANHTLRELGILDGYKEKQKIKL